MSLVYGADYPIRLTRPLLECTGRTVLVILRTGKLEIFFADIYWIANRAPDSCFLLTLGLRGGNAQPRGASKLEGS